MIHNFDINDFLENYWQQKPLLIRSAFPGYQSPISAEELAGLACEEFIESRIISENQSEPKWLLENGPFNESRFPKLAKSHWTLLIQGLNKIFPEFDDLLHEFNFIPSWRVDDLMASYAAPGGSVGPHIDQYDVFLFQATGKRNWMISEQAVNEDDFEKNIPLKVLHNFKAESDWILEAGDMLYLPPNVAHHGIGLEDCMTFSIGFRAPSHAELLSAFVDDQIPHIKDDMRYRDPKLIDSINSGEISAAAIEQVQQILISQFTDKNKIADWFGKFITEYLSDNEDENNADISKEDFLVLFKDNKEFRRPASARANYIKQENNTLALYINGVTQTIPANSEALVILFCDQHIHKYNDFKDSLSQDEILEFFCQLYNQGFIEFPNE